MEVICPECKSKLNVPDEKLPQNQTVKIKCPGCRNRIIIDTARRGDAGNKAKADYISEEGKPRIKTAGVNNKQNTAKSFNYDDYIEDDESLEFNEEGTRLAMVMVDDCQSEVKSSVEELGFKYITVPNTRDAISKLRFHPFEMVILADGFEGLEIENSPVMNFLNHLSMFYRRKIFLVLTGERFKTMDEITAYGLSANIVVNTKDMTRLSTVLRLGIVDYRRFYRVFMETLAELGKA